MAPLRFNKRVLVAQLESTYGQDPGAAAAADALLAKNVELTPIDGDQLSDETVRPYFGAYEAYLVNQRVPMRFRIDAVNVGATKLDAGEAPAHSVVTRAGGMAETIVAPGATIQASPPTADGSPTGSFTYTAGDPYEGVLDRTVTLECTTAGGSGVAEFTVSAPATKHLSAYDQTGVVMTDGSDFPLPGGATIQPTVGTDFAVGDTFTVQLTAPGTFYTPVSGDFDSASLFMQLDRNRHPARGFRCELGLVCEANNFLGLTYDGIGLFADPSSETPFNVDYSAFENPVPVTDANTPYVAIDGTEYKLRSLELALGQQVEKRSLVGQESVEITDRQGGNSQVTIEAPDVATANFFKKIAENNAVVPVELIHGTARGATVHVEAKRAQLTQPSYSEEQGIAMLQMSLRLLPSDSGNDEITIGFK